MHEVPVAELDRERVLRGCPVDVCHEDRGSQEDHGGEGRGNRTSSRFTAGECLEKEREWREELERRAALLN